MAEDDGLVNYNGKQVPLSSLPKNSQGKWTPTAKKPITIKGSGSGVQGSQNPGFTPLQNSGRGGPGYTANLQKANDATGGNAKINVPTSKKSGGLVSALSSKKFGAKMMATKAKN